jgi:hypothetical protein
VYCCFGVKGRGSSCVANLLVPAFALALAGTCACACAWGNGNVNVDDGVCSAVRIHPLSYPILSHPILARAKPADACTLVRFCRVLQIHGHRQHGAHTHRFTRTRGTHTHTYGTRFFASASTGHNCRIKSVQSSPSHPIPSHRDRSSPGLALAIAIANANRTLATP